MCKEQALLTALLLVTALGTALPARSWPTKREKVAAETEVQVVAGPIPEKITSTSVVVWWQTTAPEQSILVYGTSPSLQAHHVQRPWRTTTHEISLKKLQPDTTYYLGILQPDGTTSARTQFTTQPLGYAEQRRVRITNGPLFERITPDSATLTWSTNVPSAFLVHYGTDPQQLNHTSKAHWTPTTHRVVLRGLHPGTHYYFRIEPTQPTPASSPGSPNPQPLLTSTPPAQSYTFRTLDRGQQALNIGPQH
jgi:phosphodiesterase/alkaline phosphatase D-like protein